MQYHADRPPHPNDVAGVIAPPPLIIAAGFLAGVVLDRAIPRLPRGSTAGGAAGLLLLVAGLGLAVWGCKTMQEAGTPVRPTEPARYLGMLLMYTGLALLLDRVGLLLTLPGVIAVLRRGVVEREEQYLERKFGDDYRAYRRAVPRWLPR